MIVKIFAKFIKAFDKCCIGILAYKLFVFLFHKKIEEVKDEVTYARCLLNSISPNPNNSCLLNNKNELLPIYDLQVIIPAYKTAEYIVSCIESVLCQKTTYKILIVVVNDGSPDDMDIKLQKYQNCENVIVLTQENRGFSGARNRALSSIKARYITFLDSDDDFLGGLDYLLRKADETNADIVEGSYVSFKKSGDVFRMIHKNQIFSNNQERLLYGYPWGKIIKAELFRNICFPEKYWFEDTIMAFIIYPMCKKIVTDSTLFYHYRINDKGITAMSVKQSKVIDSYWITERLLRDRMDLGLENATFADEMLWQIKMNYNRIKTLGRKDVNKAVFILTMNLWKTYFVNCQSVSPLAKALKERDYFAYKLCCELN